ncbi:MAG: bifunctional glutamate N-acetyltransferase/amino-acid acetyltransferase ArgJ [Pirellulales bacterium]
MTIQVPAGFRLAGVHCGIKRDASRPDFTLIHCPGGATAAGVYTRNLVYAAPVAYDRQRTPSADTRVVAVNSGNANACTGERGLRDAATMAHLAAVACGATADQALVMSTGIIGEFLPLEKIAVGAKAAAAQLGDDEAAFLSAARGIMTTDQFHKVASRSLDCGGRTVRLAGMCKGAGMIGPNMATMLGVVLTDAPLTATQAQEALSRAVETTFNCIAVEGHMSTNDTVLLLASGAAGTGSLAAEDLELFQAALEALCSELCRQIPDDGEGSSHLITIDVRGTRTWAEARQIAKTIAESALVKTAICGADPNWGRIVSAAGYAGVPFDPARLDLHLNGLCLYRQGAPVAFDAATVSSSIKNNRETRVELTLAEGAAHCRFWTSDLGHEYIRINADYHT